MSAATDETAEYQRLYKQFPRALLCGQKYKWSTAQCVEFGLQIEERISQSNSPASEAAALDMVVQKIQADKQRDGEKRRKEWAVKKILYMIMKTGNAGALAGPSFAQWVINRAADAAPILEDAQATSAEPLSPKSPKRQKKKVKMKGGVVPSIASMDTDGDGVVDKAEFLAAGGTEADFALLDADGDGVINAQEIEANQALPDEVAGVEEATTEPKAAPAASGAPVISAAAKKKKQADAYKAGKAARKTKKKLAAVQQIIAKMLKGELGMRVIVWKTEMKNQLQVQEPAEEAVAGGAAGEPAAGDAAEEALADEPPAAADQSTRDRSESEAARQAALDDVLASFDDAVSRFEREQEASRTDVRRWQAQQTAREDALRKLDVQKTVRKEAAKAEAANQAEAARVQTAVERAARVKAAKGEAANAKAAKEEALRVQAEVAKAKAAVEEKAAKVKAAAEEEEAAKAKAAVEEEAAKVKAAAEEEAAKVKAADEEKAARLKAAVEEEEAAKVKAAEEEAARVKAVEEEKAHLKGVLPDGIDRSFLTVSVSSLSSRFPSLCADCGVPVSQSQEYGGMTRKPTMHDIRNPVLVKYTEHMVCRRDGNTGCALVDALQALWGAESIGMANVMLSHSWG